MPIVDYNRLVDKLREYFPSQGNMEALGDAIDQAGRGMPPQIGAPLSMAGMVVNPRNVRKMQGAMETLMSKYAPHITDDISRNFVEALAYIQTKYPKLSKIPRGIGLDSEIAPARGLFYPADNSVFLNPDKIDPKDSTRTISRIAHELTHALQNKRNPKAFDNYIMPMEAGEGTVFDRMLRDAEYRSQPVEVQARQAENTVMKTKQFYDTILNAVRKKDARDAELEAQIFGAK